MNKKNIIIFSTYLGKINRGSETFVIELTKKLINSYNVTIFSSASIDELKNNIKIVDYTLPKWFFGYQKLYNKNFFFSLFCDFTYYFIPDVIEQYYFNKKLYRDYLIDLERADIIFPNNGLWGTKTAYKLRKKMNTPFLCTGHGGIGKGEIKILKMNPNQYIVMTEKAKRWAKKYSENVSKIYNGINLEDYKVNDRKNFNRLNIQLDNKIKTVLCVGAFTPFKRQKLLIDAVSLLENVRLILLGDGEMKEELLSYAHNKLKDRFELNSVKYDDVKYYYEFCDVFSLPSLNEPFGIVYLEAMASNKPVVAPDDETRREIIGEAGVFCNVENPSEYAKAIDKALNTEWDDVPREKSLDYRWEQIANQYVEIIQGLIK